MRPGRARATFPFTPEVFQARWDDLRAVFRSRRTPGRFRPASQPITTPPDCRLIAPQSHEHPPTGTRPPGNPRSMRLRRSQRRNPERVVRPAGPLASAPSRGDPARSRAGRHQDREPAPSHGEPLYNELFSAAMWGLPGTGTPGGATQPARAGVAAQEAGAKRRDARRVRARAREGSRFPRSGACGPWGAQLRPQLGRNHA